MNKYDYSPQKIEKIFKEISEGKTVSTVCKANGVGFRSFLGYINRDPLLHEQYIQARQAKAQLMCDKFEDMSNLGAPLKEDGTVDMGMVQYLRFKADSMKWLMSKINPKEFGDKQEVTHHNNGGITIELKTYEGSQVTLPAKNVAIGSQQINESED